MERGFLGTTILEGQGTWLEGIDKRTYWVPPAHLLLQAVWYKLFGFSLFSLRSLSVLWGAVALTAFWALLRKLSGRSGLALLAAAILAVDTRFSLYSAIGRMDIMCAALGFCSWSAYLHLKEGSFRCAIIVSHLLAALSCLTHPCGVLYAGGLLILQLLRDREHLGWREYCLAAAPYAVVSAGWGAYILQAPAVFVAQFTGNISGIASEFVGSSRWSGLLAPWTGIKREYFLRYGLTFGRYEAGFTLFRLHLLLLAVYTSSVVGALAVRAIRREPGNRELLLLGSWVFLAMSLLDGLKVVSYLVHSLPFCAALVAVSVLHLNARLRPAPRRGMIAVLLVLGTLEVATSIHFSITRVGARRYEAAVAFLRQHAAPPAKIAGGAELAFALGFGANLIDDLRLGYYSGREPDFIAANPVYQGWFDLSRSRDPKVHAYTRRLLESRFRIAFRNPSYTIYQRLGP